MSASTPATIPDGQFAPGIVAIRRSTARLVVDIIRNPLDAIPPASYEARMVLTHSAGRLRAYLSDPALIHHVIVRNADRLAKSHEMKRVLGPALGEGLLTADGANWRWQRQALAPTFQHDRLVQMLPAMIAAAEATRDRWLALPPGSTVDVGHEMMRTTFAIIIETMLAGSQGLDPVRIERSLTDYLAATSWMFALAVLRAPHWLPFPGRARALAASRLMRGTVTARVAARRASGGGADDLIGMLLAARDPETGRVLSDTGIADNILTFITAGHETTAVALSWTLGLLSDHPDCMARVVAEIDRVTGDGPVRPRHIADLVYAKQVINEAIRLYPPAPMIARAVERSIVVDGVDLPPGSVVFVPVYALHRHRALWDRPDTFDPDRFAPEVERHRFAFMPFGAGPRICIGSAFATMEAVAILAVLVKALEIQRTDATLPRPLMRITLRPERPLTLRVCARRPKPDIAVRA